MEGQKGHDLCMMVPERKQLSHAMRKCVFGISDQVRFKPASSATQTSYIIEILDLVTVGILLSRQRTKGY